MKSATRILIVDDNAVIRTALSGLIRHDKQFLLVGEAGSGEAALEAIKCTKPHVVCLDVLMPGMDGLAVLQRVRKEYPAVRVVMITAHATSDVVQKALALGAHGFVVKPFNGRRVLNSIHNALASGTSESNGVPTDAAAGTRETANYVE